jgi:hypothetical protein
MQTGSSRVTTDSNQRPAESGGHKPRLLDQVRQAIRARHYSKRTERPIQSRVVLPYALARKYPNADREWGWQWAFPAPPRYY